MVEKSDYIPLEGATANEIAIQSNNISSNSISDKKKFHHYPQKTAEEKKLAKENRKKRRSRIIVRNLSFNTAENDLREWFAKFGNIEEINLLKRAGKLVGCAFVHYDKVNSAAKAILKSTGKEICGRPVHCDWAVGKDRYEKHLRKIKGQQKQAKNRAVNDDDGVKVEQTDVKEEDEEDEDNDENDVSDEEDENEDIKGEDVKPTIKQHQKRNDVNEGCTVFIKNIPFDATNDDLQEVCKQFGPIYYGLINKDSISGHSKGTGFVKFKKKESADMCLSAGTEFKLFHQILDPILAISRQDVQTKVAAAKLKQPSDSRHLYLAKEGLIVAGTPAAEGVSAADMAKRLRHEQLKTQMLKNLNRFVSRERLTIHNIPATMDVQQLRKLVEQHTKLQPKECRIMRENRPTAGQPLGKSKGFGFLSFKNHTDSLACLRKLNNNPKVFGPNNRPIVSFSIEDKTVHNIKQKRLQRSQEKNPLFQQKKLNRKQRRQEKKQQQKLSTANGTDNKSDIKPTINRLNEKSKAQKAKTAITAKESIADGDFTGVAAEPGVGTTMRSRWKLKEQALIHQQDVSEKKKEKRKAKQDRQLLLEKKSVDRTKIGKKRTGKEVDNFSFMVDKYKKLLDTRNAELTTKKSSSTEDFGKNSVKRSKWYVD